jgi:hypothetical protein
MDRNACMMHALHVSISINWLISVGFYFSGKVGFGHPQKAIRQPQLINQALLSTTIINKVACVCADIFDYANQASTSAQVDWDLDRAYVVD